MIEVIYGTDDSIVESKMQHYGKASMHNWSKLISLGLSLIR